MASWGDLQPLSTEFYSLLRYGLFLVLLIHLPFLGAIIGGSTVSLLLTYLGKETKDPAYPRFSKKLIQTVLPGKLAFFIFCLVPVLLVWFTYERILFDTTPLPWYFWSAVLAVLLAGFALLHVYRSAWDRMPDLPPLSVGAGAAGVLAVIFAFFLFANGYGILFNPEKLPLLAEQVRFFLSWNAVVKFLLFLAFFFGMTGGVILLLGGRPTEGREEPDGTYLVRIREIGSRLTYIATLALPVFVILDLITLPEITLSAIVFAASAVVLLLSFLVCLVLSLAPGREEGGSGTRVLTLYVLIFLALLLHDHAAVGNAYGDRIAFLAMQAPPAVAEHAEEERREEPAAGARAEETGKAVYEKVCAGCHQYDIRVVGPPLSEVVPKYAGDVEKLKGFIRNPVKVSPDYPSMPNLGLPEEEIDAVARFLIEELSGGGLS